MNTIELKTIGADVEMFLTDKETGEVVSAENIVKGSKYDPFQFDGKNKWFTTQLDNVLAEVTIPPAKSAKQFSSYLRKSMAYVKSILPKNLDLLIVPSASLNEKWLMTENAQTFGCEPDFNAYTMRINEKPYCDDENLRSAGGHIHIGFDNIVTPFEGDIYTYDPDVQRSGLVKMMDKYLGIPSVLMEPDNKRKELYGKAGAFRPKEYGVEYRTISNFYLASPELMQWAFEQSKLAVLEVNKVGFLTDEVANHIREVIDTNNKTEAERLIKQFNLRVI